MRRSSKTLPQDPDQSAYPIVKMSTEGQGAEVSPVTAYLSKIGRQGGLKGGVARAQALSARRRSAIAKKAAKTRWAKSR